MIESPLARLTPREVDAIGKEFDAIHDEVFDSLGDRDAHYIRSIIALHRELALLSRRSCSAPATGRHGCWAPRCSPSRRSSRTWRSDITSCTASGTGCRTPASTRRAGTGTPPHPQRRGNTPQLHSPHLHQHPGQGQRSRLRDYAHRSAPALAPDLSAPAFLQSDACRLLRVGRRLHDLDAEAIRKGTKSKEQLRKELRGIGHKAWRQILKDYIAFPALSGRKALGAR